MCYVARQCRGGSGGNVRASFLSPFLCDEAKKWHPCRYRSARGAVAQYDRQKKKQQKIPLPKKTKNKEGRHTEISVCLPTTLCTNNKLKNLCLLHRAQATGANRNGLGIATDGNLNLADVGLPTSLRFTVGVGNVFAEYNALTADTALCHP